MKYHELSVMKSKAPKRVGRGIAAGQGKTAGRGTKGQNSRTGSSRKPGFEGGQTPMMQRLPKLHGFKSRKLQAEVIYTGQLDSLKAKAIDTFVLAEAGLITSPHVPVKLLLKGTVTKAVRVELQNASVGATAAVQKAGGSFAVVKRVGRPAKEKTTTK